MLSLTNIVLTPASKEGASLWVKHEGHEFLIASLTKDKPQTIINLFVSLLDEVELIVKGNGTLHITGFYEPDQGAGLPLEDDEDEDEE